MANKNSARRVGRISLALIASTAVAVSPQVALAQTPTSVNASPVEPTSPQSAPEPDAAATPDLAGELLGLATALGAAGTVSEPGAGTSGTTFTSDGRQYTALAANPINGKLYAVQPAKDDEIADHLLRINPASGASIDLGPLTAHGAEQPVGLTTATFTNDGTLVLFPENADADKRVFTLELADDNAQDSADRVMTPLEILVTEEADKLGVESFGAFAPWGTDVNDQSLYSFAIVEKTKPVLYRYDLKDQTLDAHLVSIDPKVDQATVTREDIVAAWTKDNDVFVAADAQGETLEIVKSGADDTKPVISATSKIAEDDIASEVAQKPVIGMQRVMLQGEVQATPSASDTPASSEPAEAMHDLSVKAVDADGKPIAGATVTLAGADDRSQTTDDKGRTVFTGLPTNTYGITVSKDGFTTSVSDSVEVKAGSTNFQVNLTKTTTTTSTTTTQSTPDQIQGIIKEFTPLLAALGVPAAALGGTAGGSKATTTRTTSTTKSTTSTKSATSGARTVSAGVTTSRAAAAAKNNTAKSNTAKSGNAKSTATTAKNARKGNLADTGTPMTSVIGLGTLLLLVGAAYVFMGRRRES
ncbi:carboxypeptidase-like regulatory domain-containing protein [Corynebacterium sp. LK2510]|uniref:carboxypeptidase-like regulatory domain-containing protein n=1 Tax=Corynebacterium sp. LK2510 TaxID=3110472 RepID=UPI0034CE5338